MEKWTDTLIKQRIDTMIDESYVRSLSEAEIRDYLSTFIVACEKMLNSNKSLNENSRVIKIKTTLLRAHILFNENAVTSPVSESDVDEEQISLANQLLAEQVVRIKSIILTLLKNINPQLAQDLLEESKRVSSLKQRQSKQNITLKSFSISAGFYTLLVFSILFFLLKLFYL